METFEKAVKSISRNKVNLLQRPGTTVAEKKGPKSSVPSKLRK